MNKKITAFFLSLFLCLTATVLFGCNEEIIDHKIFVTSSNIRYGTVSGEGYYKTNTDVTLKAFANEENQFVAWVKNGIIVSTDAEYTFIANTENEGKYVAIFQGENMQHYSLKNFQLIFNSLDEDLDNYYTLTNITLIQKINFNQVELFNEDKNELFQNQTENYLSEILVDNVYVYSLNQSYELTLMITIKNYNDTSQTYTNNILLNFEDPTNPYISNLNFSDSNIVMSANFVFEPLQSIAE